MEMTLIALLIAAVGVFGAMVKVYDAGEAAQQARDNARYAAAQQTADDLAAKLTQEGENHITDMEAAFEVGESQAKTVYVKATAQGVSDVQKYPVFSNPICTLPTESLLNLNNARAANLGGGVSTGGDGKGSVQPSSNPAGTPAAVPGAVTGNPAGRQDGDAVSAGDSGHGTVGQVHPGTSAADSDSQVPRPGVQPVEHPKPTPIN